MKELTPELFTLLGKAISKDDTRKALQHLYCDGENLVATDGKILVAVACSDLDEGYYDLTKSKIDKRTVLTVTPADVDKEFPNYKQVIPDIAAMKHFNVEFDTDTPLYPELFALGMEFALAGILLSDQMLDAVIDTFASFTVSFSDSTKPVVFHNDTMQIVIMPLRGDQETETRIEKALARCRNAAEPEPGTVTIHVDGKSGADLVKKLDQATATAEPEPQPEPKRSRKSRKAA
jgi:hypothetical protein